MRVHRAVRAAASAEASIGAVRSCASRPRFLCLNAASRGTGVRAAGRGQAAQRYFSESRSIRAGAAEAV
jgi:elongation factor G